MEQEHRGKRKLAAILSADVVGYSRLMGEDDRATVETLKAYRTAIQQLVETHHGRVVNAPGDALLAEFSSAVEAVQCAVEVQADLTERNAVLPADRQMRYRIGVNLGDVIEEADGTLYGDGVNVAARLKRWPRPAGSACPATSSMKWSGGSIWVSTSSVSIETRTSLNPYACIGSGPEGGRFQSARRSALCGGVADGALSPPLPQYW